MAEEKKSVFATLNAINVNDHTEVKDNGQAKLTYLSWVWAWQQVKNKYPDANYEVRHWDGKPYLYDESLGYMCETSVTIQGETMSMWLPVMNGANKAMKAVAWSYKTRKGDAWVQPATMFDINTTIMRCLVKNLAMFGLGLYIYAGEDLPVEEAENKKADLAVKMNDAVAEMRAATTNEEVQACWSKWTKLCPELAQQGCEFYTATVEVGQRIKNGK